MTFLSWLGTLKSRNEDITSDALRIAQLEAALKTARDEAARAIVNAAIWERTWEQAQDRIAELDAELQYTMPLVAYALRRKKSLADYEERRGRK